jgi:hypothetical protein
MPFNAMELRLQGQIRSEAKGLQDAFLKTLGWQGVRKLEQFAVTNAARAWGKKGGVVANAAPSDHGLLRKSIRGRRSRITRPGAIVGPMLGGKGAWWARFVIRGAKAHYIPKLTVASLYTQSSFIDHPGVRANPFVDRAIESNYNIGADAFSATIVLLMTDEAKRNQVVGLEAKYKDQKAAYWQSQPWGRNWKNADYLEPFSATHYMPEGPERVRQIAAGLSLRQQYKSLSAGQASYGVVKKYKRDGIGRI